MYPIRMNKSQIGFKILETTIDEMDDIFREPSRENGMIIGKKYSDVIIIDEIAQIRNYFINSFDHTDKDNVDLISKVRIIFSYEDWNYLKDVLLINLKKGDLVVLLGEEECNLIIKEITPQSYLRGKPLLYYIELKDNNRPIGGIL